MRNTKQKEAILTYLKSTKTHPTAHDVYENVKKHIPTISLGTIYRNIKNLYEQGEIKKITSDHTQDHFDSDTSSHYHFVCNVCKRVFDLRDISYRIEMQQSVNRKTEHTIRSHEIIFSGICNYCNNGSISKT